MLTIYLHRNGRTEEVKSLERSWLAPNSGVVLWVDLAAPNKPESLILSDSFGFHALSVEAAMTAVQYPKIEAYDGYLYIVLHGIDFHESGRRKGFATHDIDFFLGPNYLVTVHDGHSSSIAELKDHICRNHRMMGEGPVSLFHRVVDAMVDKYRPEVEKLEDRIEALEKAVFDTPRPNLARAILAEKREISQLRRIILPQRDVVSRLARREFVDITTDMSFRFRDVYDHLVRIADDAGIFQDRVTGVLEAHLSSVNNRLNEVMKVLTVVSTIFMPLTLLSGLWGMNIPLPHFPGGPEIQFWWLCGIVVAIVSGMLIMFRVKRWI